MNFEKDFIMGLFLDDDLNQINQTVTLGMQNISNINSECLDIIENVAIDYFPNLSNEHEGTSGFFETVISTYSEEDYKKTFKMTKSVMEVKQLI